MPEGRGSGDRASSGELFREAAPVEGSRPAFARRCPRGLRARNKLIARGPSSLSHAELLVLLLGAANREETQRTAERLLRRNGLERLSRLSAGDWRSEHGLGPATAARLCAAFELGRRAAGDEEERPRLNGPRQAFRQVRHLCRARKEHLVGLYLDSQNGLVHRETISVGSLNTTRSHPREILYPAVQHLALGFILAHNHPSGCLEPSGEDVEFTRAVQRAGELMGIELYDHLIVARGGYTSLRERGLL
jgi:DNA repair protein RadC